MILFQIEFSTHRSIDFLSGTLSFDVTGKEYEKLSVAMRDSPVLKNISTANTRCAPVQAMIVTHHIWKKMLRH